MTRTLLLAALLSFSACATSGTTDDDLVGAESSATSPGSVDVWQSTDAQWHFHVVAGNGRTLLTSESYSTRTSALSGLFSVLDNGVDPAQYDLHQTASGRFDLHLVAGNHETIATTETYASKGNATRAIDACVRAVTSYLDKLEAPASGARVEVTGDARGLYHYNVFAQNGEIVLTSQRYRTLAAAYNGAFASQDAVVTEDAFAIHDALDGSYYFTLEAANHEVIGVSEMYTTRASAEAGVAAVTTVLPTIDVL
jgi:uncharacterized protein